MTVNFDEECFFIAPIGEEGEAIRKRSDAVRDLIVKEAAAAHGLTTRRADEFGQPGQITSQIVDHCLKAKMCVADLTEGNPNVYYELSVRHGKQLPVVLIAEAGTDLPFDVGQSRVVFFDPADFSSGIRAREEVKEQIAAALSSGIPADNPIANGMRLAELQQSGTGEAAALALLVERVERLAGTTAAIDERQRNGELKTAAERAAMKEMLALRAQRSKDTTDRSYLADYAVKRMQEGMTQAAEEGLSPEAYPDDEILAEEEVEVEPESPEETA